MDANWIICLILMFITYSDADLTNIRLVDGNSSTEGRVEVLYNGEWGTVCDDYFDEKDAAVVCSMLGHSRTNAKAKHKAFFGQGSGRILMDDLQCTDNDTNLFTCEQNCIGSHNCMHGEDAGVECSIYTGPKIRLVGGSNPSEGRVEVYYKNEWGTVCDDSWDSKDASVVCFTLGYSRENAVPKSLAHFGQGEDRIWIDDVTCQGTEKDFFDCYKTMEYHNCYHFEDAGVICSQEGAVRLAGGNISSEGRVEIYNNGSWGTICDKLWDDADAKVVCGMLGFPSEGAFARKGGYFSLGEDDAMHVLDDVNCTGTEKSIMQCSHRGVQHTDCSHINDAGVTCINEMPKDCGVADILIIIDDSNGSEGFNNSNIMKTLAKEIIKDLNSMLFRFSVLRYSSSVSKMFGLIEFSRLPDVIPSIDRIRYFPGTSTDTDKALKYARVSIFNSKRADDANIIILLTDGLPNNLNKTKSESDLLRKQGVRVFSVGVGNETKTEGLSLIASSPSDEHVFQVSTLGDLSLIINAVQNKTCKVEEDEDTTRSQTQPTIITIPKSIIEQCFAQLDLVFVLDSSISVGNDNYDLMKGFVTKFLRKVNIDNGDVRVGLLSYGTRVIVEFKLNSYNTKADVFGAINAIPWRYGSTNTADGLRTMHEEMFNEANGDRPGVPNICFIMTDGVSNINYRRTIPEAEVAKEKGIHIYAIGITLKDFEEVNKIASEPASTNVFTVDTFDELEDLDEKIFAATCQEVTTTLPATTKQRESGYDVIFMLDSSVPDELVFNQIKYVASNVAEGLSIDDNEFRVGLMVYSSRADVIAQLNRLSTKIDIVRVILGTVYRPGKSNLADALDYVRQNMFTNRYGDRYFARNLIVLFTGVDQSSYSYDAFRAAEKVEREQIDIYSVGFYINDTFEIDEVSTHPLNTHRYFVNGHGDLFDVPRDLARSFDDILRPERQRPYPSTTAGVKLLCPGDAGFETNKKEVQIDKDECREVDGLCEGGKCQNTIGSFFCVCPIGHRLINDRCQGDGDEVNPKCQHGFYRCPDGSCEATLFDCKHAVKDVVV